MGLDFLEPAELEPSEPDFETGPLEPDLAILEQSGTDPNRGFLYWRFGGRDRQTFANQEGYTRARTCTVWVVSKQASKQRAEKHLGLLRAPGVSLPAAYLLAYLPPTPCRFERAYTPPG